MNIIYLKTGKNLERQLCHCLNGQHSEIKDAIAFLKNATYPGKGSTSSEIYIIAAHYDSGSSTPGTAPGATDDATGCAVVLEFARIMSQYDFNSTLKFAFWNGEEIGLVGSNNYASYASSSSLDIKLNLNYDSTAYDPTSNFILDILYDSATTDVKDLEVQHNTIYGIGFASFNYNVHASCGGDHESFRYYGFDAVSSHTELHGPQYHQPTDTVDKVNIEFAKKNAQIGMSTIAWLAGIYTGPVAEFNLFLMPVIMSGLLVIAIVWRLQNRKD